jgi:hypothetical protein
MSSTSPPVEPVAQHPRVSTHCLAYDVRGIPDPADETARTGSRGPCQQGAWPRTDRGRTGQAPVGGVDGAARIEGAADGGAADASWTSGLGTEMSHYAVGELGPTAACVTASHNPKEHTGMAIARRARCPSEATRGSIRQRRVGLRPATSDDAARSLRPMQFGEGLLRASGGFSPPAASSSMPRSAGWLDDVPPVHPIPQLDVVELFETGRRVPEPFTEPVLPENCAFIEQTRSLGADPDATTGDATAFLRRRQR